MSQNGLVFVVPGADFSGLGLGRIPLATEWSPTRILDALTSWYAADSGVTLGTPPLLASAAPVSGVGPTLSEATPAYQLTQLPKAQNVLPGFSTGANTYGLAASGFSTPVPFSPTSGFSIAIALRTGAGSFTYGWIFSELTASGFRGWSLARPSGLAYQFALQTGLGGGPGSVAGCVATMTTVPTAGQNQVLIINYFGSPHPSGVSFYKNGTQNTTVGALDTGGSFTMPGNAAMCLGNPFGESGNNQTGNDDVVFEALTLNRVLTTDEIASMTSYLRSRWDI